MSLTVAERLSRVKPSATIAVSDRASALRAAGHDVIGLGAGEPDFDTPEPVKAAGIAAIQAGQTKYTPVAGTPALRQAIAGKLRRDNALDYDPEAILVSCGGKQSFFNLAQALLNPGDEAIIPAPYWTSYPDMVRLAEGTPVIPLAPMEQGFKLTPEQLDGALSARTRLLVLNSPSNPTGAVYRRADLEGLGAVLREYPQVVVATDDMYEHILYTAEPFHNILNVCPDLKDRTVVINGVSKAYAMTGWRIGYAAGPLELIRAMKTIQSQSTSNPASMAQAAAEAALSGDQKVVAERCAAFKERHDRLVPALEAIRGLECRPCEGAFYVFPRVTGLMQAKGLADDVALSEALLEAAKVAVVPGSAFGAPGHLRLSYATDQATLDEAVVRIARFAEAD